METLREELQLVVDKKSELERRLQTALNDRETMASQLEESNDRIMLLERHVREQVLSLANTFIFVCDQSPGVELSLFLTGNEI